MNPKQIINGDLDKFSAAPCHKYTKIRKRTARKTEIAIFFFSEFLANLKILVPIEFLNSSTSSLFEYSKYDNPKNTPMRYV